MRFRQYGRLSHGEGVDAKGEEKKPDDAGGGGKKPVFMALVADHVKAEKDWQR